MTSKYYEPGDVKLVKVILTKPGRPYSVDIRAQMISASIFEDIEEPSMYLEILFQDSINLVQDFPIIGEEIIDITFMTPGRDNPTKLSFKLFSIEGTNNAPSSKASMYVIKAVSQIHFFNIFNNVSKSYNTVISSMVEDILRQAAYSTEKMSVRSYIEPTKGIVPITIPRMKPFAAIDMLRQKAVSLEYPSGGVFVFYENQYGMQFRSIENLLREGKSSIKSKSFTHAPNTSSDKERDRFAMRNIINYLHLGKFDTVRKMQKGLLNTEVQSFDVLTKETRVDNYNLSDNTRFLVSTDDKGKLTNTNEFISKNERTSPNRFVVPKDTARGNDYIHQTIGIKNALTLLLNQNIVRILVYGDNYLAVGDVIEMNLTYDS
ncbi:hypothetical protein EBU71_09310 [bacterium]|nr:hypothetical protein [Candidatus Elulimicrobium humile]